ncbi:hypothetical protein ACYPKM_01350 [Pseudomonas aeruginosa]
MTTQQIDPDQLIQQMHDDYAAGRSMAALDAMFHYVEDQFDQRKPEALQGLLEAAPGRLQSMMAVSLLRATGRARENGSAGPAWKALRDQTYAQLKTENHEQTPERIMRGMLSEFQ